MPVTEISVFKPRDIVSAIHDVVSKVRSRNNMQLPPEAAKEATISLAEVHRMTDAEAVFHAYIMIFGHAPDLGGFRYYVTALRRGTLSRRQLLDILQKAAAPKARRVRILHDATEQELAAGGNGGDERVRMLYTQDDFACDDIDQFLMNAYHAILKRPADPSGMASYRDAMANGMARSEILESLLASDEYKERTDPVLILGTTSNDQIIKHLFGMVESMSLAILDLEHQFLAIKNK